MMSPVPVESLPGDKEPSAAFEVMHASPMTRRQPMSGLGEAVEDSPDLILGRAGGVGRSLCLASRMDWTAWS